MAVRAFAGTARPIDSAFEGRQGFRVVEWDDADGSIIRGYERLSDGALLSGACFVVSPARQAVLDAINTAASADNTNRANFIASIVALAQAVKDNTATAAQQRQLMVKLSRAVLGLMSDLP
jgi:hypothetical protein